MDEQKAIERLKQGDITGLEVLVRNYYHQAVRAVYFIVQEKAQAEDIVQSSFVNLHKKIHQFDQNREFRPWFFRSVVNRAISMERKRKRTVTLQDYEEASNWVSSLNGSTGIARGLEEDYITEETSQSIWLALEKLTPIQRAAIVMRYYLELSEKEISHEMEKPKSTVKWTLYSARQKLQKLLRPIKNEPKEIEKEEL